jgi:hypothetical protein
MGGSHGADKAIGDLFEKYSKAEDLVIRGAS